MKILFTTLTLMTLAATLFGGQADVLGPVTGNLVNRRDLTPEQFGGVVINHLLTKPSPLKNGVVQVHRMGDHAAIYLDQIMRSRTLSDAELQTALDIIHMAFENPPAIVAKADRSRIATMNLLLQLDASAKDSQLRQRIGETITFVNAAPVD